MAWRLARSLEQLREEINAAHRGTTFWTIGDQAHRNTWSDHNPNASGVVCAADVLGDKGLNLAQFAERVRTSGHPALKYVIFNRRIANAGQPWRPYYGDNPHSTHVHVSVGVGPDGRSTGPYDNTTPWGIGKGDDDVSAKDVWTSVTIPKIDPDSGTTSAMRPASYLAWNHEYAKQQLAQGREILANQAAIMAAVGGGDVAATVRAELDRAAERERAERRAELGEVVDQLGEITALVERVGSGELAADEVVRLIGERLTGEA